MRSIMNIINMCVLTACFGVKNFITDEVRRIKEDESGMEIVQVVIILLIVIVIVAALWAVLGPWVTELLDQMNETKEKIKIQV